MMKADFRSQSPIEEWFSKVNFEPFEFQKQMWQAISENKSGILFSSTGSGKTYAVWGGFLTRPIPNSARLRALWITPLRALGSDITSALLRPVEELGLPITVESRTGDTGSYIKTRQRKKPPSALVTTPESLSLLLTYAESSELFSALELVVVDEWHELLSSKRGTQVELALARLRRWSPNLATWGLSATLSNPADAARTLIPHIANPELIQGGTTKKVKVFTILPQRVERFRQAGHLGLALLKETLEQIEIANTSLVFCNTRSQAERWYRAISEARPEWLVALHHGSIDSELRLEAERKLSRGELKCLVCTSSLDLGVDFGPVDKVVQIGSPKGVARFMQRAGRSGHRPGEQSEIVCVPTHALELIEFAAVQDCIERAELEDRLPLDRPMDVLVQHVVTIGLGGGFDERELYEEVISTQAFSKLSREEWSWVLDFVSFGGPALRAYEQFAKLQRKQNHYDVTSKEISRFHRLSIGTIVSDAMVSVQYPRGGKLGNVEESFVSRLKPCDVFSFGGKVLELVQFRDMKAYVRLAKSKNAVIPRWLGGRMPLSSKLSAAFRRTLKETAEGKSKRTEAGAVKEVLELQSRWSIVPAEDQLLVESIKLREGYAFFVYPFEGRAVHEGLGALLSIRMSKLVPATFSISVNDYGIHILSTSDVPETNWSALLSAESLIDDILASLNSSEMARRHFREISRIAGLVFNGYPGKSKNHRQLQVTSGLLYDVFMRHDSTNLLLEQSKREVLEQQLEIKRLSESLKRMSTQTIVRRKLERLTPFAFPLWVEMVRARVSSESWESRIERMIVELEHKAESQQ